MPPRALAVLLAAIGLVFWPVLGGAFVYDDELLVVRNTALQNGDLVALLTQPLFGDQHGYWRPLTSLSLWLGNTLGGACGIHALALLLHAAATLAAWSLAHRLLGDARRAFAAALLFALHPVQVESVAWCSAINDPLWGLCALLCLRSFAAWRTGPAPGLPVAAMVWLLLALLAKENAIAAVPMVLVVDACLRRGSPATDRARPWLALAIVLAVWWALRALVFGGVAAGLLREAAHAPPDAAGWLQPVALFGAHARVLAVPWTLTPFRTADAFDAYVGGPLATLAATIVLVAAWRARRPLRLAVLVLLVAPLVPTLIAWRSIGAYPVADRYLYLAAFGLALAIVSVSGHRARWFVLGLAALFGVRSFVQTWVWHDQQQLVRHGLAHRPEDPTLWRMTGDLALARAAAGDRAALGYARDAYRQALDRAGTATAGSAHRARAEAELGIAWCLLTEQGGQRGPGTPAMLAAFQRAVDSAPESAAAWVGLGVARGVADQPDAAEQALRRAIALEASSSEAWFNLGSLQARIGRRDAARTSLAEALRCNPRHAAAQDLLDRLR